MIVGDVETTGLDKEKNSIVSIGAIDFFNSTNYFYEECRIWKGAEIDTEALKINGFSEQEIRDIKKPSLEKIIKDFSKWLTPIEDITLAGQNPQFDLGFLSASAKKYNIKLGLGRRIVDLHTFCYLNMLSRDIRPPLKKNRTNLGNDEICKYVGIPIEPRPHNALNGAKYEAETFSRLIYGKNLLPEFAKFPIPEYLR
jgi:DNA polymerase-3 subunit epsilon